MRDDGITLVFLTQGKVALIDTADAERVLAYNWYANPHHTGSFYARNDRLGKLHRFILGLVPGNPMVDHVNQNSLDNRRSNLRLATMGQNKANGRRYRNNTSGYRGVEWREDNQRWAAKISINGRQRRIGGFATAQEAARAYDEAAKRVFGEFASLNFPDH